MPMPHDFVEPLKSLVEDIVNGNYQLIANDGRSGRLDYTELVNAVVSYDRPLVLPPLDSYIKADGIQVENKSFETWLVDYDLWTSEGESDLTLSVTISRNHNEEINIVINDLHTL